jgi:hypothetical protein
MPGHISAIVCLLSIESARDTRPDLQVLLAQRHCSTAQVSGAGQTPGVSRRTTELCERTRLRRRQSVREFIETR